MRPAYPLLRARIFADAVTLLEPRPDEGECAPRWENERWVCVGARATRDGLMTYLHVSVTDLAEALGWDAEAWAWFAEAEVAA